MEIDLRKAVANDQLDVAYQPIVRTADGLVTGVEALLRWDHPERGPIPPPTIIAIAEQCELIDEIGAWVLERGLPRSRQVDRAASGFIAVPRCQRLGTPVE